jgi:hypothetical protein
VKAARRYIGHILAWSCCLWLLGGAQVARAEWDISPQLKLRFEERYDDYALFNPEAGFGAGQLMSKLTPQIGVDANTHTFRSNSWYASDFMMRHGSGRFTWDHRAGTTLQKELSDRAALEGRMSLWRVSDPTSLPRLGVARTLTPVMYGKGEAGGSYRVTERWTSRAIYRFEGAQVYEVNRPAAFVHAPSLENWYRMTRRNDLGLEYRFQYFAFGVDTAHAHGAFAGFRHRLTRSLNLLVQAGPVYFERHDGRAQGFMPKATVELAREGETFDLGFVVGHDLVGASGFSSAVWADFASLLLGVDFSQRFRLFGAASYFRNGVAPNVGFVPWETTTALAVQGYAVGVGAEWKVTRSFSLQLAADRLAQLSGTVGPEETEFSRNIVALRLNLTAWE